MPTYVYPRVHPRRRGFVINSYSQSIHSVSPAGLQITLHGPGLQFCLDKFFRRARHGLKRMPALAELERLYDDHSQALYAFLLNFTRSEADTHDLLQELFIRLAQRPRVLEGVRNLRAFLLRLAHNLAIDLVRRRGARHKNHERWCEQALPLFAPAAEPDERAFREALAAALGELAAEQCAVIHLKLWEGLTFDQIADLMEIPLNTAASRYRYGLDKLRQRLRPLYDEIK